MRILLVLLVLISGGIITGAFVAGPGLRETLAKLSPQPARTEVQVKPAARKPVVETVTAPGEVEPHTKVDIRAVVSAYVTQLPFDEGDEVKKGDMVCELDARVLQRDLVQAKAMHASQQSSLEASRETLNELQSEIDNIRLNLQRAKTLHASGNGPQKEVDDLQQLLTATVSRIARTKHSIGASESQLEAATEDINRAQDGVDNTVIKAPMDGKITLLNTELGEVVTGSTQQPGTIIMTIADLSRMTMEARIAESDIASVQVGQQAKIHINAYPEEVFSGTVTKIALQRSGTPDGTGFFVTEIEIDLQGRQIYSGLVANVDIEIETHNGIAVPNQSIVYREIDDLPGAVRSSPLIDHTKRQTSVVYRLLDGKAVCTPGRTLAGAGDLSFQVVKEGLSENDPVIVGPYKVLESLKDGDLMRDRDGVKRDETDEPDADTDDETAS